MWPNPQFPADLVTFTGDIFNRKLRFFAVTLVTNINNSGVGYLKNIAE